MTNLNQYRLKEIYQDDGAIYRALYFDQNNLLRVQVQSRISEPQSQQYRQAQIVRMKGLFANAASPYPGEISDEIACGEKFIPQLKYLQAKNLEIAYFTGYLNQRLVFGACTEDQAIYHGFLAFFYCPKQAQFFQLELIAPKEDFFRSPGKYEEMLQSISCKK